MNDNEQTEQIARAIDILNSEVLAGRDALALLDDIESDATQAPLHNLDLATLLSEMTSLRAEIRKETQAAQLLRDDSKLSTAALEKALDRADSRYEAAARKLDDVKKRSNADSGKILISIVDRLETTASSLDKMAQPQPRRFWWPRKSDPRALALAKGMAITLRHIHERMKDMGIARIETKSRRFDPLLMEAVGAEFFDDVPEGSVVAEILPGYNFAGEVFRPAQVIIAKRKKD